MLTWINNDCYEIHIRENGCKNYTDEIQVSWINNEPLIRIMK